MSIGSTLAGTMVDVASTAAMMSTLNGLARQRDDALSTLHAANASARSWRAQALDLEAMAAELMAENRILQRHIDVLEGR